MYIWISKNNSSQRQKRHHYRERTPNLIRIRVYEVKNDETKGFCVAALQKRVHASQFHRLSLPIASAVKVSIGHLRVCCDAHVRKCVCVDWFIALHLACWRCSVVVIAVVVVELPQSLQVNSQKRGSQGDNDARFIDHYGSPWIIVDH